MRQIRMPEMENVGHDSRTLEMRCNHIARLSHYPSYGLSMCATNVIRKLLRISTRTNCRSSIAGTDSEIFSK